MRVRAKSVKSDGCDIYTQIGACAGCGVDLPHKFFCHGCRQFICEACDQGSPNGVHDVSAHFEEVRDVDAQA
jgi:hypothetical protein